MQQIADALTAAYGQAGFFVSRAYLPPQSIGPDRTVEIRILEGKVGKVIVEGNRHYQTGTLSSFTQSLLGQTLRWQDLQQAMLYTHDLPGVSVSSVLRPGANPGETDIVITAKEANPVQVTLGVDNRGTESTGHYRAQAGLNWNSPLGLGDLLAASYAYGLDPTNSWSGAISYSLPDPSVPGLSAIVGYNRSQIELTSGPFAALGIHGPTTQAYYGADWKFVNRPGLQWQASLRLLHEESRLDGLGIRLSQQAFDAIEGGFSVQHADAAHHVLDLIQVTARKALTDGSAEQDWLYPEHDSDFFISRLAYTHLQALTPTQRLMFRLNGQYSRDALTPMEQFALGGPDNVRAFGLSEALGDRGYQATAQYHMDAPGFADVASPFRGLPWAQVLGLNLYYDYGRVYPAGSNRNAAAKDTTFQGAGAGIEFHLPWQGMQLQVSAAHPTGATDPADGKSIRYWASFGMTF